MPANRTPKSRGRKPATIQEIYRRGHPTECNCQTCGLSLKIRCQRMPCAAAPRGDWIHFPCNYCGGSAERYAKRLQRRTIQRGAALTQLHRRVRTALGLGALGFQSEQWINPFRVDELLQRRKLVVEINGDYAHANPAKHKATDRITLGGTSYTASAKWAADQRRLAALRSKGYTVLVVWESDDLEAKRAELARLLEAS